MNKAFVREPDDNGQAYCPRCRSLGVVVHEATLVAQLRPDAVETLADPSWFCPFPTCEVAYFDLFERVALVESLLRPVYPKDPDAPLCACFGFTVDDVEQDLAEAGVRRIRELLEKAKSSSAHCSTAAPTGQSCVAEVQRYFMRRRAENANS